MSAFFTFLSASGHMGLPMIQGSMKIVFPPGVSMRKVEWPNHVSFTPFRFMSAYRSWLPALDIGIQRSAFRQERFYYTFRVTEGRMLSAECRVLVFPIIGPPSLI